MKFFPVCSPGFRPHPLCRLWEVQRDFTTVGHGMVYLQHLEHSDGL